MDPNQIGHIDKALPSLLQTIICNSRLLAELVKLGIICPIDVSEVEAKSTEDEKCACLIRILKTRKDAFQGLIESLVATNQNGAVEILQRYNCQSIASQHSPSQSRKETIMRCEEIPAMQFRWEHLMVGNKEIFMKRRVSEPAMSEFMNGFYSEEMNSLVKDKKYVGINVREEYHQQICASMMKGFLKVSEAYQVENIPRVREILNKVFDVNERKYISSLNGNLNLAEDIAIGIDLGTCNCCVAACINGTVKIFTNSYGDKTTPSYVCFNQNGSETVGKAARENSHRNAANTIFDVKRIIGREFQDNELQIDLKTWPFKVVGDNGIPKIVTPNLSVTLSAVEVSAILLKECVNQAMTDLQKKVSKAVITVPAYFNDSQIKATKKAGELAGLKVLKILKEPTAAAIMYRQERNYAVAKRVLIFDMGGGTFDVAVADISDDEIDIVGIDGDMHLGGEDFDQKIVQYCLESFKNSTGCDLTAGKSEASNQRNLAALKLKCEEQKKYLSTLPMVEIDIARDEDYSVKLTRETFEEISMDLFTKMISIVDRLLKETKVTKEEIEDVILVGGSTRIPKLKALLSEYFLEKPLNHNANQDYAVAYGAAIVAAEMNGEDMKMLLNLKSIKDVIPMSIGVQCVKDGIPGKFSIIIEKNSKYPTFSTGSFRTFRDNQEAATLKIFQGENENVAENFFIGSFRFEGIPRAPRGTEEIEVCMHIDNMGILNVSANCRGVSSTEGIRVPLGGEVNPQDFEGTYGKPVPRWRHSSV